MNPFSKGMFQLVGDMNTAFGNAKGDPANIDMGALRMQAQSIGSEFVELMKALGYDVQMTVTPIDNPHTEAPNVPVDMDDVRDALCDILVFDLGAFHRMGIDAEADMEAVVSGVMTRFCKDEMDLLKTRAKYDSAEVLYTVHGEFPRVYLRSAIDQQMPEYPKGKFLKSASYRGPRFSLLPAPLPPADPRPSAPTADTSPRRFMGNVTADMATQREASLELDKAWRAYQDKALGELKAELDGCSEAQRRALVTGQFQITHSIARSKG